MAVTNYSGCTWYPIRSGNTCPVCNSKKGRCSLMTNQDGEVVMYRCKYKESERPSSDGWYIHLYKDVDCTVSTNNNSNSKIINLDDYQKEPISEELLDLWDRVYRRFRQVFLNLNGSLLYKEHKENLITRGLNEKQINNIECFSIPRNQKVYYKNYECQLKTAIVNELLVHFKPEDLIRVPGFKKVNVKGKDYVTFKNVIKNQQTGEFNEVDGFFIPYTDHKNRIVGMQYRLTTPLLDDKGKPIRYLWYVSNVSCGSPISYYAPIQCSDKLDDVILLTEGALKAKIASERMSVRSLAEAGVSNYRNLIKTLQLIEAREKKKYKVLLALDMDKYTNPDVIKSEINTVSLLKGLGYTVTILEWNEQDGKGLDDKLEKTGNKDFRFLTI